MKIYTFRFLEALGFTLVTETLVIFFLLRRVLRLGHLGGLPIVYAGIMASFSSLPYFWFVLPAFIRNYTWYQIVGELAVLLWEAIFYLMFLRLDFRQAMLISLAANLSSYLLGLLIFG